MRVSSETFNAISSDLLKKGISKEAAETSPLPSESYILEQTAQINSPHYGTEMHVFVRDASQWRLKSSRNLKNVDAVRRLGKPQCGKTIQMTNFVLTRRLGCK